MLFYQTAKSSMFRLRDVWDSIYLRFFLKPERFESKSTPFFPIVITVGEKTVRLFKNGDIQGDYKHLLNYLKSIDQEKIDPKQKIILFLLLDTWTRKQEMHRDYLSSIPSLNESSEYEPLPKWKPTNDGLKAGLPKLFDKPMEVPLIQVIETLLDK